MAKRPYAKVRAYWPVVGKPARVNIIGHTYSSDIPCNNEEDVARAMETALAAFAGVSVGKVSMGAIRQAQIGVYEALSYIEPRRDE